jgi:hypothetical protein
MAHPRLSYPINMSPLEYSNRDPTPPTPLDIRLITCPEMVNFHDPAEIARDYSAYITWA